MVVRPACPNAACTFSKSTSTAPFRRAIALYNYFVIVIRVRYGESNTWLENRVLNHVEDVSMLTRVKGTSTPRYIIRRVHYKERVEKTRWDDCIRMQPYYKRNGIWRSGTSQHNHVLGSDPQSRSID